MVMASQSKMGAAKEPRRADPSAWLMGSWLQPMGPSWMVRLHHRHGLPACKVWLITITGRHSAFGKAAIGHHKPQLPANLAHPCASACSPVQQDQKLVTIAG